MTCFLFSVKSFDSKRLDQPQRFVKVVPKKSEKTVCMRFGSEFPLMMLFCQGSKKIGQGWPMIRDYVVNTYLLI